jgi:hypothetical protein
MTTENATPDEYFFSRSRKKSHPDFKKLKSKAIDEFVLEHDASKKAKGNAYRHTKSGYREDLGMNFRSNWEANFARILNAYKISFEFEPKVFTFPIKRGTKGYTPDFYYDQLDEWIELKGYLDDKSKIKLKRFKRYYPEEFEKMTMIISKYSSDAKRFVQELEVPVVIFYEDIKNYYMDKIPNWEGN